MQRKEPLVTIGLPFKNPGSYIIKAIKSILCQTYKNWELILINDGSNDGSDELVETIRDERIHYINDSTHRGLPYRLNQICELANGKYIARMDADDIMHPERIEKQVNFLENMKDVDVVDTGAFIIDENDLIIGKTKELWSKDIKLHSAFKWGIFLHPAVMGKTSWFERNKYSDSFERAEDRELFIRALYTSNYAHICEKLHFYRRTNIEPKLVLKGYESERKVLNLYGPQMIGKAWTNILLARSKVKSVTLVVMNSFGLKKTIMKKMYVSINKEERDEAEKVLNFINAVSFQ